ncbi:MAG: type IV toxin-antitoxin system AbiEi family antitoxin [Elusimicrobia bacterium]|nr:type IV toxin-antitoxin system AbiEi family antitoxin [Elusimicrobiota bacterium]
MMKSIFYDKSSLILRKALSNQDKRWVIRDFTGSKGVSIGLAQKVLKALYEIGCIDRKKMGAKSYAVMSNPEVLLEEWVKEYKFHYNKIYTFYTDDKKILSKVRKFIPRDKYALTLHSGANFYTSFVNIEDVFMYLESEYLESELSGIVRNFKLKKLVKGGNIHFIKPVYRNSVFYGMKRYNGYSIVSPLQLYLDLYNYSQRGKEHAIHLKNILVGENNFYG